MGNAKSRVKEELTALISSGDEQHLKVFLDRWTAAQPSRSGTPLADPSCFVFLKGGEEAEKAALGALDLNDVLPMGCTALQLAARSGHAGTLRQLLELPGRDGRGAVNINGLDASRRTALHYAARHVHPRAQCAQVIADLLHRKADPCIAASDNTTPLDVARRVNCVSCVRTIEDNVKLWQGWVDHYEPKMLLFAKWTPKWLVVLQDRRPNSGEPSDKAFVQCVSCSSTQQVPPFVAQFSCRNCSTALSVSASSQLAVYEPSSPAQNMILPDSAKPTVLQKLPQFTKEIVVSGMRDDVKSIAKFIWGGNIKRALQNTGGSERTCGFYLKILNEAGQSQVEHNFRVATERDRGDLVRILSDPLRAAYEASQNIVAAPASLLPSSSASASIPAASNSSASASAPSASQPAPKPSKTSGYELQSQAAQPGPSPVTAAAASQSSTAQPSPPSKTSGYELRAPVVPAATVAAVLAPAAAATTGGEAAAAEVEGDEEGQCVVCLERAADTAVIPCGHMCGCSPCLQMIRESTMPQCPLCRGPLSSVIRIYSVA